MKRAIAIITSLLFVFTSCINTKADERYPSITEIPRGYIVDAFEFKNTFNIDPFLLLSLCYTESRFNKSKVGGNVTQVTRLKWFEKGIEELGLDDPKGNSYQNMMLCAYYLREFYNEHPEETYLVLECWNEGKENAEKTHNPQRPSYYAREITKRAEMWSDEWEIVNLRRP